MKKILVGVDGSDTAYQALEEGIRQARSYAAELHVITVQEIPVFADMVGETERLIDAANERAQEIMAASRRIADEYEIEIVEHIYTGQAVKRIVELAEALHADMLVVGFMGVSALYDRVMGSTCATMVRLAPCSVLVVKP